MTVDVDVPQLGVLLEGFLVRDGPRVADAGSTVSLVRSSDKIVVVDTGSPKDERRLVDSLRASGVSPVDVDFVVNTHLHVDHCGCNDLFPNARTVAHRFEDPPVGTMAIQFRTFLLPGVELVPTPGHSRGSMSVFVSSSRRTAICGDAIPTKENYEKHVPPFINIDRALAIKSMDAILEWADMVVPGHGAPFGIRAKEYDQ